MSQTVYFTTPSVINSIQNSIATTNANLATTNSNLSSLSSTVDNLKTSPSKLFISNGISTTSVIQFLLNGNLVTVTNPDANTSLLDFIRTYTMYKGTKKGCNVGGCGICTVMISFVDRNNVQKNISANSCLVKLVDVNKLAVTTNEGIGSVANMHPIQQHFFKIGAFQCGFCTSGQIMNMYTAFQTQNGQSNQGQNNLWENTEKNMDGNLCRCTGYRPIIEAFKTLMVTSASGAGSPYFLNGTGTADQYAQYEALYYRWKSPNGNSASLRQLPIYNPSNDTKNCAGYLAIGTDTSMTRQPTFSYQSSSLMGYSYYNVASLDDLSNTIAYIGDYTKLQIVQGQTSRGVPGYEYVNNNLLTNLINVSNIPELNVIATGAYSVTFGAGTKIAQLAQVLENHSNANLRNMGAHFKSYASTQIRNWGTVVGGVMLAKSNAYAACNSGPGNAYFPSDAALVLQAAGATFDFNVYNSTGVATSYTNVPVDTFIATSYAGAVVVKSFTITTTALSVFRSYRQAARKYNAHAECHLAINTISVGGTYNNTYCIVGALGGPSATQGYQRITALESYINGKAIGSITEAGLLALINVSNVTVNPFLFTSNRSYVDQQVYGIELVKGFMLQWYNDLAATGKQINVAKSTVFGNQQWYAPDGTSVDMYAKTGSYISLSGAYTSFKVGNYQPNHANKVTGEVKFTADYITEDTLYAVPIFNQYWPTQYNDDGNTGAYYIEIDYANPLMTGVLGYAKAMTGVVAVYTYLDFPTYNNPLENNNKTGVFQAGFQSQTYYTYQLPASSTSQFVSNFYGGWPNQFQNSLTVANVRAQPMFPTKVLFPNMCIGMVVGIRSDLAKVAADYIGQNMYYLPLVTPVPLRLNATFTPSETTRWQPNRERFFQTGVDPAIGTFVGGTGVFGAPNNFGNFTGAARGQGLNSNVGDFQPFFDGWTTTGALYNGIGPAGTGTYQTGPAFTGSYYLIGQVDPFAMERMGALTIPYNDGTGRFKVYMSNQGIGHAFMAYKWGTTQNDNLTPINSNVDGQPMFAPEKFDIEIPAVGGAFGGKLFTSVLSHWIFYSMLAAKTLQRPVLCQPIIGEGMLQDPDCGKHAISYKMAYDATTGRITAASVQNNHAAGYFGVGGGALANESMRSMASIYNFNKYACYLENQRLNTQSIQYVRAPGHYLNSVGHHMIQKISNATSTSTFDVMLTNLMSEESPYLGTGPFAGANANLLIRNTNQAGGLQFANELSWAKQIRAIDRKVASIYYTTGAKSQYYPSGYSGGLASPNYTGVAYNNASARYPAIKQLEANIATFNASSPFVKQGLAVMPNLYTTGQSSTSPELMLSLRASDRKIVVKHGYADCGAGGLDMLKNHIAEQFYISPDLIEIEDKADQLIGKMNAATSAASFGGISLMNAAFLGGRDLINRILAAIYVLQPFSAGVGVYIPNLSALSNLQNYPTNTTSGTTFNVYDDSRQLILVRFALSNPSLIWTNTYDNAQKAAIMATCWNTLVDTLTAQNIFDQMITIAWLPSSYQILVKPAVAIDPATWTIIQNTVADFLYINPSYVIADPDNTNLVSAAGWGSLAVSTLQAAAKYACMDMMNKTLNNLFMCQSSTVVGANFSFPGGSFTKVIIPSQATLTTIVQPTSDADDIRQYYLSLFAYNQNATEYSKATWDALSSAQKKTRMQAQWITLCFTVGNGVRQVRGPSAVDGSGPEVNNATGCTETNFFLGVRPGQPVVGIARGGIYSTGPSSTTGASVGVPMSVCTGTLGAGSPLFYAGVSNPFMALVGVGSAWANPFGTSGITSRVGYSNWGTTILVLSFSLSIAEVNTLTGEAVEKLAILVPDVGNPVDSLNVVQQVEGAYTFGKGYFIHEDKLKHPTNGRSLDYGTWEYKPACSFNTPERLETCILNNPSSLLTPLVNASRNNAQYNQKPIGEIAVMCAGAYWVAIREAIRSYKVANSINNNAWLDTETQAPLTTIKIKNACPVLPL
jgi:xanthine dehydrogenase iron-sulfur cluster and FAD-binding subunit A